MSFISLGWTPEINQILIEFTRVSVMSLAFITALYGFFTRESYLKEGADRFLFVIFFMGISVLLSITSLIMKVLCYGMISIFILIIAMIVFIFGWVILLLGFWRIYGRIYHMRQKRFMKHIPFISKIYLFFKRKDLYIGAMKERRCFSLKPFNLHDNEIDQAKKNGASIFIFGDVEVNLSRIAMDILVEGLKNGETGDYVCCQRPPGHIWQEIASHYDLEDHKDTKPTFIDAYTQNFGFSDEIFKLNTNELTEKDGGTGLTVIPARTIASIHTASNTSWYINRKDSRGKRNPHRMIYDRLSSLIAFSGIEHINSFIRHFMVAEKFYGMITIIVETRNSPMEMINTIYDLADYVIEYEIKQGKLCASMKKRLVFDFSPEHTTCL